MREGPRPEFQELLRRYLRPGEWGTLVRQPWWYTAQWLAGPAGVVLWKPRGLPEATGVYLLGLLVPPEGLGWHLPLLQEATHYWWQRGAQWWMARPSTRAGMLLCRDAGSYCWHRKVGGYSRPYVTLGHLSADVAPQAQHYRDALDGDPAWEPCSV